MAEGFTTAGRYFGNKHYPRGFSRRDDFAIKEAQLLERRGYAFNELDPGKHEPVTEEEKLFVTVCHGEHKPVTEAEHVWSKYTMHIKRPKHFHTLSGDRPQAESTENYTDSDD